MPHSTRFADEGLLFDHFTKHRSDFGVATAAEYEALAVRFLDSPLTPPTEECRRARRQDIVRYNPDTDEFGVKSASGVIRTYYKPGHNQLGRFPNVEYFMKACRQ